MSEQQLRDEIEKFVRTYVREYADGNNLPNIWREPIVGYADARSEYVQNLKEVVLPEHHLPQDFLPDANVIICYFIPFTKQLEQTNIDPYSNDASKEWGDAYNITNTMMARLNAALAGYLIHLGYQATVPDDVRTIEGKIKSNWSQKHLAYAAGLGTFGINNLLIGELGCCGRYNSIVAQLPITPDAIRTEELCLYKSKGICKKCVKNCFSGALTVDGFNRGICQDVCTQNRMRMGTGVCGKCGTNIPCGFKAPL